MTAEVSRVIALGASNLTRGFHTVVSTARAAWGPGVEILAALGHGRSYGAPSRVLFRSLPGILDSGLWRALEALPAAPSRALVTDVGNDILYGFSAEQTLEWVDEALGRLSRVTHDIILTDLPLASIRRVSQPEFVAFRTILVPSCRLSLRQVRDAAERVTEGLAGLSSRRGAKFFQLKPGGTGSTRSTFGLACGTTRGSRSWVSSPRPSREDCPGWRDCASTSCAPSDEGCSASSSSRRSQA